MGYYIRVLGTNLGSIPMHELREAAQLAVLHVEGDDSTWEQLTLAHKSGRGIAVVEKNAVVEGQLAADELREFSEEVPLYKPESAVAWLQQYLATVKVIYAFQLLNGTDVDDGWTPLHHLYRAVWKHAGGILQADGEGFSNEAGSTILWQFGEEVTGKWNMGVIKNGSWLDFEMDLGNDQHRKAFWSGELPDGVKLI
jgi:hypothetical protein